MPRQVSSCMSWGLLKLLLCGYFHRFSDSFLCNGSVINLKKILFDEILFKMMFTELCSVLLLA